jgi:putative chitinase
MTEEELRQIVPNAGPKAGVFVDVLTAAMDEFAIATPASQAAFIANVAEESGALQRVSENLNYRPDAILATFNTPHVTRFTHEQAELYGRTAAHSADQEMIANIAYANRMGNGDVASGDGWRHRGLGLIETTGADNQRAVAEHFGVPFETVDQWLQTPEGAARSAAYFWKQNGLNELADAGDFVGCCAVVNTGNRHTPAERIKGYPERLAYFERAKQVLGA